MPYKITLCLIAGMLAGCDRPISHQAYVRCNETYADKVLFNACIYGAGAEAHPEQERPDWRTLQGDGPASRGCVEAMENSYFKAVCGGSR